MTLIIGAKCTNGVVIVTDTKAIRGTDELFESKVLTLFGEHVILAASGNSTLLDKFRRQLMPDIESIKSHLSDEQKKLPVFQGKEDFLEYLEDKMRIFKKNYSKDGLSLELLVGFSDAESGLHFISTESPPEEEIHDYLAIGHGAPYSKLLMKTLWNSRLKMVESTALLSAIFHIVISTNLDITVGGFHQLYFIPNGELVRLPNDSERGKITEIAAKLVDDFNNFLKSAAPFLLND